ELGLGVLAMPDVDGAVPAGAGRHLGHQAVERVIGEPEVHVAPVRLGGGSVPRNIYLLGDPGRDRPGVLAQVPGKLHAGRARVLAVSGDLGAAKLEIWNLALDAEPADRVDQRLLDLLAHAARGHEQVGCRPVSVSSACVEATAR